MNCSIQRFNFVKSSGIDGENSTIVSPWSREICCCFSWVNVESKHFYTDIESLNQDSAVLQRLDCTLEGQRIFYLEQRNKFSLSSGAIRLALGPMCLSFTGYEILSQRVKRPECDAEYSPHLLTRLSMIGAIPLFPPYVFVAWRGKPYFHLH